MVRHVCVDQVNTAKMVRHGAGQLLVDLVSNTNREKDQDIRKRASAAFRNLLCCSVGFALSHGVVVASCRSVPTGSVVLTRQGTRRRTTAERDTNREVESMRIPPNQRDATGAALCTV